MRLLFINHIQNARQSLKSSRVRSMLTMLGVTIGVASITTILALSGGANKIVNGQIESIGGNIALVRPGKTANTLTSIAQSQLSRSYVASTLSESDIDVIKETSHVKAVAPIMTLSGTIKADSVAPSSSTIVATTPDFDEISDLKFQEGQFLNKSVDQNSAVIGIQLSVNVFGSELSTGRTIIIRGQPFLVIGVLQRTNNPINYNSIDFDNTAFINFEAGKTLNKDIIQIQQINVKADSIKNLNQVVKDLSANVQSNHDGENDFSVLYGTQISQPTSQLFYAITGVSTAVAAISLIVGGIGIMNIMLVTVAERTREIGIRKALGASNSDILWQFLIESLAIGTGGGIAGFLTGCLVAFLSSSFLTFDPVIDWNIAIIAMTTSISVGTIFGIYPAIKAAKRNPIESLHQYH